MSRLPLETLSIVAATLDEVQAAQATIMLRMWHHLATSLNQEALFNAVTGDGQQNLIEGFLAALRQRVQARWPKLRASPHLCEDLGPALEQAFRQALADALGRRANAIVLNAWSLTLRDFLLEMCQPAASKG